MNNDLSPPKAIIFIVAISLALVVSIVMYQYFSGHVTQLDVNARIAKDPNQAELYYLRGCNHEGYLNKYINPFKSDEEVHKDWEREAKLAIADFTKAIELAPDFASAYYHRGRCKIWYQKYDTPSSAAADYEKAVEFLPYDAWLRLNLARAYSWAHQPEKAIATYEKAVALGLKEGDQLALRELKELREKKDAPGSD